MPVSPIFYSDYLRDSDFFFFSDLVQVWRDLAEGPPIVVPRKLVIPGTAVADPDDDEEEEAEEGGEGEDEEADPNDAPILPGNAIPKGLQFMEDDEDDW